MYEAIFIPDGVDAPPYEIINQPELQVYVTDFGKRKGDICYVSECDNKIVGAVWVRIMDDYGHVDDETPSFAISLLKEYRNYGIGTELMKMMKSILCFASCNPTHSALLKKNKQLQIIEKSMVWSFIFLESDEFRCNTFLF